MMLMKRILVVESDQVNLSHWCHFFRLFLNAGCPGPLTVPYR
jgi:hypothetical protein